MHQEELSIPISEWFAPLKLLSGLLNAALVGHYANFLFRVQIFLPVEMLEHLVVDVEVGMRGANQCRDCDHSDGKGRELLVGNPEVVSLNGYVFDVWTLD